jgi:D-alanyl-D-alanine carboxypeptidase/D-alanyl-D-alanine-endopeptidase (penicillin-binding protein 4)
MLELREAGVRHIDGDIVLDRQLFNPARLDIGVPPFDESPEFPYNVIPDALQLAGNLQVLELVSDRSEVRARLRPELPGVRVDNRLTLHPRVRWPVAIGAGRAGRPQAPMSRPMGRWWFNCRAAFRPIAPNASRCS